MKKKLKLVIPWRLSPGMRKTLLYMKLTFVILLAAILQSFAVESYSQNANLSIKLKNARVQTVLQQIEKQSEFYFLYSRSVVDVDRIVDVEVKNAKIFEVLNELFDGTDVAYKVEERQIVLSKKENETNIESQQQKSVTGKVTDSSGTFLPGVSVVVKGTTTGVITNGNGNFSISNIPENAILQFSFVGMRTQEIAVGMKTSINVTLTEETIGIEEVVAIGYGTVKKSDLTGSVASVASNKLDKYPTTNVLQALQGKAAGLSITSNNGAPGSSSTVRIRGGSSLTSSSEPLWVVDGFPGASQPEAEDIESIEVLRDASSTAIFGSRGSNGVILVTTKKGASGGIKVEVNSTYSIDQISKKYDVLNGTDYAHFANDFNQTKSPGSAKIFANPESVGEGTNWQDEVSRQGAMKMFQFSVTGGTNKVKVYSSAKYSKTDGIIINSNNEYYTGKLNLDANVSDKATVSLHMDFNHYTANKISSQTWYTGTGGITGTALLFEPWLGIYDANGKYTTAVNGYPSDNPYASAVENQNQSVADNFSSNISLDYELFKGLKFYTSLAVGFASSRNGGYTPTTLVRNTSVGAASLSSGRNINLNSTTYFTYDKTFADIHKLTLMAGHDYQKGTWESFTASSKNFPNDAMSYWSLGSGSTSLFPSSSTSTWVMESFYGRLNYSLKDRYLLTFTGRYDGCSRFGNNVKWGFFPSTAFRWNVKKESFMQSIDAISQMSLHAGYGNVGNASIGSYTSLARLNGDGVYRFVNGQRVNALVPTAVENAKLSWETNIMSNIGIDLGFFNGRVSFSAEYYNNETTNMLYNKPLPQYSGYSSMTQNYGEFRNRGVEFTLGTKILDKAFKWSTDFNISFNRSKVITLPNGDVFTGNSPVNGVKPFLLREGETTNAFYGYVYDGVDNNTGFAKYRDISGPDGKPDGKVSDFDQKIIGNANPDFTFGWTNDITYKNFDLNIQIAGSYGNQMINCTRMELESMTNLNNTTTAYFDAWKPTHTNTNVPLAGSETQFTYSTRWVEDASFLRVQNIALGYSIPSSVISKLKINKCRLFLSVQNALLLTKYSGYDPEVTWNPGGYTDYTNVARGLDYDAYPKTRNYTMGINITF